MTRIILALVLVAAVAGCARVKESRFNPLNWFGRSETVDQTTPASPDVAIPLIGQVTSLRVEQVPGGAIIRATGLPERQGFFAGDLVPDGAEIPQDGVLVYHFSISAPRTATDVGTPQSREVIIGRFVSDQTLQGVRKIKVTGATNSMIVRR